MLSIIFVHLENNEVIMTKKSHLIEKKNKQHNQLWEWEETPELLKALEDLEVSTGEVLTRKNR